MDTPVQAIAAARRMKLLDVCVDSITMEEALSIIASFVESREPHQVITLDASMCVMARTDSELREIIHRAELVTPDSAGILWAARRYGRVLPERVAGVEMIARLAALGADRGWRLFLLGAAPGVAEEAAARLLEDHPDCVVAGVHHGYFRPEEEPQVVARIVEAAPDVLCVGMGIPRQEKWIARHRQALGVPVMVGVGGTFDVLSGRVTRAPRWMQERGLEWAYRLLRDPRKIKKVLTLPRFVAMVLTDTCCRRRQG